MKLSTLKQCLSELTEVHFFLADGTSVPAHVHLTEVGSIQRKFIDCGGTLRDATTINMQLWYAQDVDHRLSPQKLLSIIEQSERALHLPDAEVEVEYQTNTIGRYALAFANGQFILQPLFTDCLASDSCGIPAQLKPKKQLADLTVTESAMSCTKESGCC
jgi:Family of unknown function (DUF6428)